jgi:ankyrin repeat protein
MKTARAKLLSAASENRVPEAKEIIENAALLDIDWTQKESGLGALHRAAQNGHHEVVRLLLGHPLINVNQKTHHDSETSLLLACDGGHTEAVRVLLADSRVELNLADLERMTPLMCASLEGHLEIVKLLVADGRNLGHEEKDKHGDTAVDGALDGKHHEIVSLLMKFCDNPAQTQHIVRMDLGLPGALASGLFALLVFIRKDLLQQKIAIADSNSASSFTIAKKLPTELQMTVCHRVYRSGRDTIPSKDSETSLKSLQDSFL